MMQILTILSIEMYLQIGVYLCTQVSKITRGYIVLFSLDKLYMLT